MTAKLEAEKGVSEGNEVKWGPKGAKKEENPRESQEVTMYRAPTSGEVVGEVMEERERHRRSIRIAAGDYSQPGCYFVTICAVFRRNIFGMVEDGKVALSPLGEIVRSCWLRIPEHFPNATTDEYVVMPNHLHGIIALGVGARYIVPSDPGGRVKEAFQKPTRGTVPTIVRAFKAAVARNARTELKVPNEMIWQSNYYERVLRDGREVAIAMRYIAENPARWMWDEENAKREKKGE